MSQQTKQRVEPLRSGVSHWKWQRISALLLIPLTFWLLFSLLRVMGVEYAQARDWVTQSHVTALLLVWLVAAVVHAVLGMEVILEDYISHLKTRKAVISIVKTILYLALLLAVTAIVRMKFL